ncbi:MAG: SemiSWEET family sugar transporter [Lacibacter sp.]
MTFDQLTIIGVLTIAASYMIKLIGFPQQAIKIFKSKKTKNVSWFLFLSSFISYILWTYYGYLKNDWVIMWGQSVGILTSGIVLYLLYKFRSNDKDNPSGTDKSGT